MPSFAIAQLRNINLGPEIVAYLAAIDQTLAPYGGRFLVHGNPLTRLEGTWPEGDLIIIAFPSRDNAEAWYASEAYRKILPLRQDFSEGDVILVDGVSEDHKAMDVLKRM
jgi:uncharacterized protein (DUF1330 family)